MIRPAPLTAKETARRLLAAEKPLIFIHTRPDGDAVGSGAALCRFYMAQGKKVFLCPPDKLPDRLRFLVEGLPLLTPDVLDEIDADAVITLDVASRPQLGRMCEILPERLMPTLQIDHHERGELFADHFVMPDAAATGEVLFSLFLLMEKDGMIDKMPAECADPLFAAIASDTGGFRFSNTSADSHRAAAELLVRGADAPTVNRLLFESKSPDALKADALAAQSLTLDANGRIAHIAITEKLRADAGLADEFFDTAINIARSVAGVEIAASIREIAPQKFKVSLRAIRIDVAAIAASFGGGGHRLAAGFSFSAPTAEEVWEKVLPSLLHALDHSKTVDNGAQ